MLDGTPTPEKVALLCGELLQDDGVKNPRSEHVARLLGYALAFAHINFSGAEERDATDKATMLELIVTAAAAAEEWHEDFSDAAKQIPG
ncbi:hypothetical protein ACS0VU_09335 [Aliiroseovarius sp. KMU-71]|uniref:hypothetical protein n=1 Tax=Aliiroseovarius sp. KMU-71 TaxID=3453123 RepID=UPI003F464363